MNRSKVKTYVFWILFTEAVGILAGLLTREAIRLFNDTVVQPSITPPAILFPVVWTILYGLMGISMARVSLSEENSDKAKFWYILQLAANFLWSLLFFNGQAYFVSFLWIILLWILILKMIMEFWKIDLTAAKLQIPYLLWVTFAAILNYMVYTLNQ